MVVWTQSELGTSVIQSIYDSDCTHDIYSLLFMLHTCPASWNHTLVLVVEGHYFGLASIDTIDASGAV